MDKDIDFNWLIEAEHIAEQYSTDRSVKVGAIIVDPKTKLAYGGYNTFPRGIEHKEERFERPMKYLYTEHAERNAIYNMSKLGVSTDGCHMYITWYPCTDCTRAIIQSGITHLICRREPDFNNPTFGEGFKHSEQMLKEAGIEVIFKLD